MVICVWITSICYPREILPTNWPSSTALNSTNGFALQTRSRTWPEPFERPQGQWIAVRLFAFYGDDANRYEWALSNVVRADSTKVLTTHNE